MQELRGRLVAFNHSPRVNALGSIADAIESSGATPEAVEMFVVGVAGHLAESFPDLTQAMQEVAEAESV